MKYQGVHVSKIFFNLARQFAEGETKASYICHALRYDTPELHGGKSKEFLSTFVLPHNPEEGPNQAWWDQNEVDERVLFLLFLSEFYKGKRKP